MRRPFYWRTPGPTRSGTSGRTTLPRPGPAAPLGEHRSPLGQPTETQPEVLSAAFGLFSRYIAGKIIIPYLVLIFLLAVFTTYTSVNLIDSSVEDKFRDELILGGRSANEAMVSLEDRQLGALRQMVQTIGVDEPLVSQDPATLQRLIAPIAVKSNIPYVDVLSADGRRVLAFRSKELGPDAANGLDPAAPEWDPIHRVLRGDTDELGDKYAGIVSSPSGHLFVTAAPLKNEGGLQGVVAVALPFEEIISHLSQETGLMGVSLYGSDGRLISTSIRGSAGVLAEELELPRESAAQIIAGDRTVFRRASVTDLSYVEALGVLAVRRQPAMVMGVGNLTVIEDRGGETRHTLIAIFGAVVVLVLLVGLLFARRITQPVRALVEATERIRRNELDFELPVATSDETGILTVAFNEMRGGLREGERSRVAIETYMSPKVYRLIQTGALTMGGVSRQITVFKTDIREFTSISETMDPEALIEFLNRYFARMVAVVTKHDGEVDKYMGDAILAKFGATEWYPDHARRAVLAMIEMIEACDQLSEELRLEGKPPVHMGIGANTGEAVVGNLGSVERMEYTIVSDAVNTAQRIEELCKELGWDLLIGERTYEHAQHVIEVGEPWVGQLRGQTRDTLVYPVLGRRGEVSSQRRRAYDALAARRQQPATAAGEPSATGHR